MRTNSNKKVHKVKPDAFSLLVRAACIFAGIVVVGLGLAYLCGLAVDGDYNAILDRIAAENADIVLAYGPNSCRVVSGARTGGMSESRAKSYEKREELVAALKRIGQSGDVMLFKGSHGMHMELALEQFLKDDET
jgi:UDP-N-acetylmuramyl pentapeptide synthase